MVGIVIGLFMLCWAPAHFVNLWMKLDSQFPMTNAMYFLKMTFHTLSYFNRFDLKGVLSAMEKRLRGGSSASGVSKYDGGQVARRFLRVRSQGSK